MLWSQRLVQDIYQPQVIHDSKTPSGSAHLGSLRGVLIHDAIYRSLVRKQVEVKFLYGLDDYDPLDGLPPKAPEYLHEYMGVPLCNIPPPPRSKCSDFASHHAIAFVNLFLSLGVQTQIYRMRDCYRSGKFNEVIDIFLQNAAATQEILNRFTRNKFKDRLPFQMICQSCGKIASTKTVAYHDHEVEYICQKDLVSWTQGCGYHGKHSPFDGAGKLPWKLEWAGKWSVFDVSIEGAGKDHCTKGGSRNVADLCSKHILQRKPPLNVPYEFFLVDGRKMSSSKGMGVSLQAMYKFLPNDVLRFMVLKPHPKSTVNFSPKLEFITRLFNSYDRLLQTKGEDSDDLLRLVSLEGKIFRPRSVSFSLLTALVQIPHIDTDQEVQKRFDPPMSMQECSAMHGRIQSVKYWLRYWSTREERLTLQTTLPASAQNLSLSQSAFLHDLADNLDNVLSADDYQKLIFQRAHMLPIEIGDAFSAIYTVLFDRMNGPKAGAVLSFLGKDFSRRMFKKVPFRRTEFLEQTVIGEQAFTEWLLSMGDTVEEAKTASKLFYFVDSKKKRVYFREKSVLLQDGKQHLRRVFVCPDSDG